MVSFINENLNTLAIIVVLNIALHMFLMRFFKWYNKNQKPVDVAIIQWILIIPPVAIIVFIILQLIGLIVSAINSYKNEKSK